jgi:CheY-like chemotaxis protein
MSRILVIDDEDPVRAMLCMILGRLGHSVIEASNGKEGLDLFHKHLPDLVITDIVMPEKEGLEVVMTLKQSHPNVKIIAISGGGRQGAGDNLRMAKFLGATLVLPKPMSFEQLTGALDALQIPSTIITSTPA